jgi:hypothetical protein
MGVLNGRKNHLVDGDPSSVVKLSYPVLGCEKRSDRTVSLTTLRSRAVATRCHLGYGVLDGSGRAQGGLSLKRMLAAGIDFMGEMCLS